MRRSYLHTFCCFLLMLSMALVLPAPAVTLSTESGSSTTTTTDESSSDDMGTLAVYGLLTLILGTLAWVALRSDFGDPLAAIPETELGPVDASLVFAPGPETADGTPCELSAAVQFKF